VPSDVQWLLRIIEHLGAAFRTAIASGDERLAELIAVALVEAVALQVEARKKGDDSPETLKPSP
jgi:hypothetical protein